MYTDEYVKEQYKQEQ